MSSATSTAIVNHGQPLEIRIFLDVRGDETRPSAPAPEKPSVKEAAPVQEAVPLEEELQSEVARLERELEAKHEELEALKSESRKRHEQLENKCKSLIKERDQLQQRLEASRRSAELDDGAGDLLDDEKLAVPWYQRPFGLMAALFAVAFAGYFSFAVLGPAVVNAGKAQPAPTAYSVSSGTANLTAMR